MSDETASRSRAAYGIRKLLAGVTLVATLYLTWMSDVMSPQHLGANLLASYLALSGLFLLLSRAPLEEALARLLLTTISVAVVLVCFEGAALLGLDYRALLAGRWEAYVDPAEFEPALLHARPPHLQLSGTMKGNIASAWCLRESSRPRRYELRYDNYGFRNDSDLQTADVAVIGDSYLEGIEVSSRELATSVLARSSGLTVANLGRQGVGPQEELVLLQRYALALKPKVIVWAFFEGNDLRDLVQYDAVTAAAAARKSPWPRRKPSFTATALEVAYRAMCRPSPIAARRSAVFRTAQGEDVRMYFSDLTPPGSRNEAALDRFRAIIREAFDSAQQQGVHLALAFVPIPLRVYRDLARFPLDTECLDTDLGGDLPERIKQLAAGISPEISFVDLTPVFRRAARNGELAYLPDDTHWSPLGHRLAGEALSEMLARDLTPSPKR